MYYHSPLKDRILKGSIFTPKPSCKPKETRPSTYKFYSNDKMEQTLEAVIKEGHSVRYAAEEYNVP